MGEQDNEAEAAGDALDYRDVAIAPSGCWPEFQDRRFAQLLRHWAECRRGLMMPRAAIDPLAIRDCLPNVWIYQHLPESDDFVCTLSGETVNQAWGQSLMGKNITQIMPTAMQATMRGLYHRTMTMPAVQVSRRRIVPADGPVQSAERLIVPLSRDDDGPYGLLGMTIYFLGNQASLKHPRSIQGDVTLYDCRGLPATLP